MPAQPFTRALRVLGVLALFASATLAVPTPAARAATYRNHIARVPSTPTSLQTVRIWIDSDTALGETAGVEIQVGSIYTKYLGIYDATSYPGANWYVDIPAFPHNTTVSYQLFTRNEFSVDYGFTGFNWSYTVSDGNVQWFGLRHTTFDPYYRAPFGAVPAGTPVTLRFRTFPLDVDSVDLRVYVYDPATDTTSSPTDYPMTYLEDRVENSVNYAIWTVTITPTQPSIWYYKFKITDRLDVDWFSDNVIDDHDNLGQGGEGAPSDNEPFPAFQITVYDPNFQTPDWLKHAHVYQIFPDRFRNGDPTNDYCRDGSTTSCPSFYGGIQPTYAHITWNTAILNPRISGPHFNWFGNQFYGGDLQGVEEKLDYLRDAGVDTIYFTPIFKGSSNHRYDTDNYFEVDPALGGNAALASLVREAETRGMRIILDGVFNHTSSDSLYFDRYNRYPSDGACESLSSPFRSWFVFTTTNVPCTDDDYEGWFGYRSLPELVDNSSAVRDFFYRTPTTNVTQFWLDAGAAGWRFDVADNISHDWWRDFRPYAKSYAPDAPLIGEVWPDASRFLLGEQLDSVMNYRFRKNVLGFARGVDWQDNDNNGTNVITGLTPSLFNHAILSVLEDYPLEATQAMLNLLDSHDTNRALYVLTLLGDNGLVEAKERLKLASLFQFTFLGAPMVYYGDEVAINAPSQANHPSNGPEDDPYNRAPYPWPDASGDVNTYGPPDFAMRDWYARLARIRKQVPALRTGSFRTLHMGDLTPSTTDNHTFAFARSDSSTTAIVAMSNGSLTNTAAISVSDYYSDSAILQDMLSGATLTVTGGLVTVTLAPRGGALLLPASFTLDETPPTATASATPAANSHGWNNSDVSVTLSGTDTDSGLRELRYFVNAGGVQVTQTAPISLVFTAEGIYTVTARAFDQADLISAPASVTVRIDKTPPTATHSVITGTASYTLTLSAGDARSGVDAVVYSVNGGAPQPYTAPLVFNTPGTYLVSYHAVDRAGNASTAQSVTVTVYGAFIPAVRR